MTFTRNIYWGSPSDGHEPLFRAKCNTCIELWTFADFRH